MVLTIIGCELGLGVSTLARSLTAATQQGERDVLIKVGDRHVSRTSLIQSTSAGGAPVYVWPGGGITFMVDVTEMPLNSFGYVPTPAIVAPIEFTLRRDDYAALGGHVDEIREIADVVAEHARRPHNIFIEGAVKRATRR